MSDEKLRELERKWKESQSVDDEAAYLLERVRVGDLEKSKLELAAYCSHEAARLALGDRAPEVPKDGGAWSEGFKRWGLKPVVCAALAMERYVTKGFLYERPEREERFLEKTRAAENWLKNPTQENAQEAWGRDSPAPMLALSSHSWALINASDKELRKAVRHAMVPWALQFVILSETDWLVKKERRQAFPWLKRLLG